MNPPKYGQTRRAFLRNSFAASAFLIRGVDRVLPAEFVSGQSSAHAASMPWYRRAYLWGQTNITERDPLQYDIAWWRKQWQRTHVQALIINAGGIVAYYPSKFPLHHRAEFLKDRDLFGELRKAAQEDGLFVMARMDSNRTAEDFFKAHPDWFARDRDGQPYRAAEKYITCINSPYYDEYLPSVLREIIERSRPDGFTDNSWAGLGRNSICYCANCEKQFRTKTGEALPRTADWDSPVYREWIMWSYARRTELWEQNNQVTRKAGGPHCIWSGMNSGSISGQARSFRDLREICRRADILMLDHQARDDDTGFQQNGDTGKRVHSLLGWDKLAPESMAMYLSRPGFFRLASQAPAEARMWMVSGIAGGIHIWWHHIGAYHEDRRMYGTAEPVARWWKANQQYMTDRQPVASVGIVWSQRNTDFFGREAADDRIDAPYTGFMHALIRARIPYLPIHADDLEQQSAGLKLLILPNVGALSDTQAAAIRRFVQQGGSLLATGDTGLYTEWGDPRPDSVVSDLFACRRIQPPAKLTGVDPVRGRGASLTDFTNHTYLRLTPELRGRVNGPRVGDEPAPAGERHAVLRGFDETDILPYGGTLVPMKVDPTAIVPLTFVPPFPTYPPETSWMRQPKTDIPGLVLSQHGQSRVAYLPADLDRRYARFLLPDHAALLANIVRWAGDGSMPLEVDGAGFVDCHLYRQKGRLILHLVNLTSEAARRAPLHELIKVGPLTVKLRLLEGMRQPTARLLVSQTTRPVTVQAGMAIVDIPSILDHELLIME